MLQIIGGLVAAIVLVLIGVGVGFAWGGWQHRRDEARRAAVVSRLYQMLGRTR